MDKPRFLHYKRSRAWQVLVSCGPDQEANDAAHWAKIRENSPFAATLKSALSGAADFNNDGAITAAEIAMHVREEVVKIIEGNSKPQIPELIHMAEHRGGEFLFLDEGFDFDSLKPRTIQNPYKGLLPYRPEDTHWYFGREEEIEDLLEMLVEKPIVIVSGPSAVGKSSFVQAGIYPTLKQQYKLENPGEQADFDQRYELYVLRPGSKPWTGEPMYISQPNDEGQEEPVLAYHTGLQRLCKEIYLEADCPENDVEKAIAFLDPMNTNRKRIVFIDQYEELFAENNDPTEVQNFTKGLIELYKLAQVSQIDHQEESFLRVILSIRSDFEWELESQLGQPFILLPPKPLKQPLNIFFTNTYFACSLCPLHR